MARDIDFGNLTEDDYPYLQARSWLVQEAELQGHHIREEVEAWKPKDQSDEYDADQDVRPAPQVTGDAESLGDITTEPGGTDTGEEDAEEIDYHDASKEELQTELRRRGLSTSGNKDELIARLEADDNEEEEV